MITETKRASWLELFYDVAFIALVAQLTYMAAEYHHTLVDFLNIAIVGYSIFIAWWATTANRNLQPSETASDKFLIQIQMVGIFLMSISMDSVFQGEYLWFFLTLALVRLLQSFMIIRMYLQHPDTRPVTYNILEGFFAASALWALSAFLPDPYHFVVAFMALAIDVLVPLTRGQGNTKRYLNVFHLQERLGLFLMLVIGESMIVVALSTSAAGDFWSRAGIVFSGLALMISLWWLYFEHSDQHVGTRPKELFTFLHAHGLLFGGIILVSVGYKVILEGEVTQTALALVAVGITLIAATLALIRAMLHAVCLRASLLIGFLFMAAAIVVVYGYQQSLVVETVLLMTTFMAAAAVLDRFGFFNQLRPRTG
jgi:low temperature requirement protein LtrA